MTKLDECIVGARILSVNALHETSLQERKGLLWAIGFIGSTSHGMKYLSKVEGLLNHVFQIAESTGMLPLKSVGLNVVNMFAQNFVGRDLLEDHGWIVHALKQDESGNCDFMCTPKDITSFLKIQPSTAQSDPFTLPKSYMEMCQSLTSMIKDSNDDEKGREFIEMLERLPNSQQAWKPFSAWIHGKDLAIFNNTKLFYLPVIFLTFYNLPMSVRRALHLVLDYFLLGLNFVVLLDSDSDFEEFLKI